MSKVSVIVPVYNVEKYVAQCLDTIINQSYENIEIICVNDGSKDNSKQILDQYARLDSRVVVIDKENGGLSSARNAGVEASSGDYILFVDSDDYLSTNAVELCLNHAKTTDADVVYFDYVVKDDRTNAFQRMSNQVNLGPNIMKAFNASTFEPFKFREVAVATWLKFYKTEFLRANNIQHKVGTAYEDVIFWSDVLTKANRITYLPEPLYCYVNNRPGSIMHDNSRTMFDILGVYREVRRIFQEAGYWERYKECMDFKMMVEFIYRYYLISEDLKEEFYYAIKDGGFDVDFDAYNYSDYTDYDKKIVNYYKVLKTEDYEAFKNIKMEIQI